MFPGLLLYRPPDARSSGAQKNCYCNASICNVLYGFRSVFHLTYSEFFFFFANNHEGQERKWSLFLWKRSKRIRPHNNNFVVVLSPSHVQLFVTPWTAACQSSLSLTLSQSSPKFMSTDSRPSDSLTFSFCLQSFPALGSFPMSQLFTSGGQSTEASAIIMIT